MKEMSLGEYSAAVDKALSEWDVATMRILIYSMGEDQPADDVLELSMHKTRVERASIDPKLRLESVEWLRAHGWKRYKNLPLPPKGVLPT